MVEVGNSFYKLQWIQWLLWEMMIRVYQIKGQMFIIISMVNLYTKLGGYFELSFVMAGVGNSFINYSRFNGYYGRWWLESTKLKARCFWLLWEFLGFIFFPSASGES
jgi:hypothetical protein